MEYRLEVYGWEVEAMAHSISDEQVELIKKLMVTNESDELWMVRDDVEIEGIIDDIYNPDLFHTSRALDNSGLWFSLRDENDKEVFSFEPNELGDPYEIMGEEKTESIPYEGHLAIPEMMDEVDNIFVILDENKGGIAQYVFESDTVPTPKDFCIMGGDISTPNGDWDFISKYFFKGEELEVNDHLDNSGKASTVEIYRKDGTVIS